MLILPKYLIHSSTPSILPSYWSQLSSSLPNYPLLVSPICSCPFWSNFQIEVRCHFFLTFCFEVIIDSYDLIKKCTGKFYAPIPQSPPVLSTYTILVQYKKQKVDVEFIQISLVIHALVFVYLCHSMQFYHMCSLV